MKKTLLNIVVFSGLAFLASCGSPRYIAYRPAPVTVVRPGPPYAAAVWIGPEYRYQNRRYVTVPGHYVRPRPHQTWQQGYWRNGLHGRAWTSGRWRRH